jgi:uncharacterized membrane protein YfcA
MAPMLIIFLGMPAAVAVGTALVFASIIKMLVVPVYMWRRQVNFRIAGWMLLGGVPGVVAGGLFLSQISAHAGQKWLYVLLGVTIVLASLLNGFRLLRPQPATGSGDRPKLLAALMFPVGAETGFSSAGSGALGSLALLGLTPLTAAEVVGTGVFFGLIISVIGGGIQLHYGNFAFAVLLKLLTGGVLGAFVGTTLAVRIPSRPLKWALAVWLATLGAQLCWRGFA